MTSRLTTLYIGSSCCYAFVHRFSDSSPVFSHILRTLSNNYYSPTRLLDRPPRLMFENDRFGQVCLGCGFVLFRSPNLSFSRHCQFYQCLHLCVSSLHPCMLPFLI